MQQSLLHSIRKHTYSGTQVLLIVNGRLRFALPTWNLFTQENEHRAWSQLSAGQVFSKIRVLAKSRNRITVLNSGLTTVHDFYIIYLYKCAFPSMLSHLSSISKHVTSFVIQKFQWALHSSVNLSCFFIFYCISTTFSHWSQIVFLNK